MKIAIIYATKTGTTRECTEILKMRLPGQQVEVFDLDRTSPPEPSAFDAVIVGGPIRFGKLHKSVKRYLTGNARALAAARTAYFIVCGYADRFDEYCEDSFTPEQRRNAVCIANFGGTLKIDRQKNIFTKLLVRSLRNDIIENGDSDDESAARILPEINPTEISKVADMICRKL